jgi:flagellar hook-length control protein FliK
MTIETTRAPEGAKNEATQASRATASASRSGAPKDGAASGGFAGLMSLLSATDVQVEPVGVSLASVDTAPVVLAPDVAEDEEQNMPLAHDAHGLIALNLIPEELAVPAVPAVPTDAQAPSAAAAAALPSAASDAALPDAALDAALPDAASDVALPDAAPAALPSAASPSAASAAALTNTASANSASANAASASAAAATKLAAASRAALKAKTVLADAVLQQAVNTDVATLLGNRRVSQAHAAVQTQLDLRQASAQPGLQPTLTAVDASRAGPILVSADVFAGSPNRREGSPATGQVRTGLEGATGSSVADRLGISATYEVAEAAAVVAEGQVAETVSYWASKGVQNAELTLDGLGDEPVQVRISVEGDQTQIDFISDQPEVRQMLESASAQLKALLSGQGLQLTGMSVGTSGQGGGQDNGRQPPPGARQTKLVSLEPAAISGARVANAAVGQSLDLYV